MCLHKQFFERDISREYLNQSKFMAFGAQYNEELYAVKKRIDPFHTRVLKDYSGLGM
jgi:hypothetical protein